MSEFSALILYSHSFLLGFPSRRKENTSLTREMLCHLCLLACSLAGQSWDTARVPLQAGMAAWQKTPHDSVMCEHWERRSPEQQCPGRRHCRHAWLF